MKFLIKMIEKEIHKDLIRLGFFLLFFGLFIQYAQDQTPKQCVAIGALLLILGMLFPLIMNVFSNKTLVLIVLLGMSLLTSNNSFATAISMPYCNEATGGYVLASHWNSNCSTVGTWANNQNIDGTTNIAVGGIQTANLANLAVTDAKIAGITTAGKVNGSAITSLNNVPSGAGVLPTANLGSGSATSATFLRGDQTWAGPLGTYVKVSNTQTSGTAGGTITSGSWLAATLNTKDNDTSSIATLNSNLLTLPSGTYIVHAVMPMNENASAFGGQIRLFNSTDSSVLIIGQSLSTGGANVNVSFSLFGEFTLSATKNVSLQYQTTRTETTDGQGAASSFGTEVYAVVDFIKIS